MSPSLPPPEPTELPAEPTEDEAMEHVGVFLRLVFLADVGAEDPDVTGDWMTALLDNYLTPDAATADLHCWYLATVGRLVVHAGIRQVLPAGVAAADFWSRQRPTPHSPAEHAAFQAIDAQLAGHMDAALQAQASLFDSGGGGAVMEAVGALVRICVGLKRQGAFPAPSQR